MPRLGSNLQRLQAQGGGSEEFEENLKNTLDQ
jgi:hypothetical protein